VIWISAQLFSVGIAVARRCGSDLGCRLGFRVYDTYDLVSEAL
jgi:hypothetical protein